MGRAAEVKVGRRRYGNGPTSATCNGPMMWCLKTHHHLVLNHHSLVMMLCPVGQGCSTLRSHQYVHAGLTRAAGFTNMMLSINLCGPAARHVHVRRPCARTIFAASLMWFLNGLCSSSSSSSSSSSNSNSNSSSNNHNNNNDETMRISQVDEVTDA